MSAAKTTVVETCSGLAVVTYAVEKLSATEATVNLIRVVPARYNGCLCLGEPVTPTRDEKVSLLKAIGAHEFGWAESIGGAR